jgi:RHS repeat-associated protein
LQDIDYEWDANGNLLKRHDKVANKLEQFSYDHLDRLDFSVVEGNTTDYNYDNRGNLILKGSETRSYTNSLSPFRVTQATVKGTLRAYEYDGSGHVLSDSKRTYTWASDGQLKTVGHQSYLALKTLPETLLYTSQQNGAIPALPGIPSVDIYASSSASTSFDFDSVGKRVRQSMERNFVSSAARCITGYFGNYERETHETKGPNDIAFSTVKEIHRHKLGSAVYTRMDPTQAGLPDSIRLAVILTDHIGSTDVVVKADWDFAQSSWKTAVGQPITERQSFDAWGDRRNGDDWSKLRADDDAPRHTSALDIDQGFTGHEMLDDFGLIHMNGRIYDPELGRFLSPDPFVQVPEYSQNFNRYSYVLNNPLSYTDPSGHFIGGLHMAGQYVAMKATDRYLRDHPDLAQAVNIVVTVVLSIFVDPITAGSVGGALNARAAGGDFGDMAKGAAIGALQGAVCAYGLSGLGVSASGSVKAAVNSPSLASIGAAAGDVAIHAAGHGLVGGAANAALGGKFQDGFISAAVSSAAFSLGIGEGLGLGASGSFDRTLGGFAKLLGRTAVAGIIGGTASAVGGGKFANGAYASAFQHLANDEHLLLDEPGYFDDDRPMQSIRNLTDPARQSGLEADALQAGVYAIEGGTALIPVPKLGFFGGLFGKLGGKGVRPFFRFFGEESVEVFYRTMSRAEYDALSTAGGLTIKEGAELFVSTAEAYSRSYLGKEGYEVLVMFHTKAGTLDALAANGVKHSEAVAKFGYGFLPDVAKGWMTRAQNLFKVERGSYLNVGLGYNPSTFNSRLNGFKIIE